MLIPMSEDLVSLKLQVKTCAQQCFENKRPKIFFIVLI